jgi:uncharacterized protein with HEPN domain
MYDRIGQKFAGGLQGAVGREGVTKDELVTYRRTQQAVVLNLMTIAEAAARIVNECKEFATAHPEIPWAQMRGMRNRMVHGRFDVDSNIVWDAVRSSLPQLESQLRQLLESLVEVLCQVMSLSLSS